MTTLSTLPPGVTDEQIDRAAGTVSRDGLTFEQVARVSEAAAYGILIDWADTKDALPLIADLCSAKHTTNPTLRREALIERAIKFVDDFERFVGGHRIANDERMRDHFDDMTRGDRWDGQE